MARHTCGSTSCCRFPRKARAPGLPGQPIYASVAMQPSGARCGQVRYTAPRRARGRRAHHGSGRPRHAPHAPHREATRRRSRRAPTSPERARRALPTRPPRGRPRCMTDRTRG